MNNIIKACNCLIGLNMNYVVWSMMHGCRRQNIVDCLVSFAIKKSNIIKKQFKSLNMAMT